MAALVVEDQVLILIGLVDDLTADGIRAYAATDADAAMSILETRPDIGLVFTDVDMPGTMDGLDLARAVRERWPYIHVIVASGRMEISQKDVPERCLFISKPYDNDDVVRRIREILPRAVQS